MQVTAPKEQNTQQSPARGRNSRPHPVQSYSTCQKSSGSRSSAVWPQWGQLMREVYCNAVMGPP